MGCDLGCQSCGPQNLCWEARNGDRILTTCSESRAGWLQSLLSSLLSLTSSSDREGNGNPLQYSCLGNPTERSLVGYSPWGHEELDMTEQLHFHFSFSCIGEGNGNPLQCSCLENPRMGAWWAVVYGVTQSWTRLT